jgi:broad specificity phosphatase PhoE
VIALARHGRTAWNADPPRMQGRRDLPLDGRGREQAARLAADALPFGFAALWTSRLVRARETAEIVGRRLGLVPTPDDRLAEADMGGWEGRLRREIEREDPEAWAAYHEDPAHFAFPGGESLAAFQSRVCEAIAGVAAGPLPALVVCHGGTIRCAVAARRPEGLAAYHERRVANAELVWLEPWATEALPSAAGRRGG